MWLVIKLTVGGSLVEFSSSNGCRNTPSDSDWLEDNDKDRPLLSPSLLAPPDSDPVLSLNMPVMAFRTGLEEAGNSVQPPFASSVHCIPYLSARCWWAWWELSSGFTEKTWQEQFTELWVSVLWLFWTCQLLEALLNLSADGSLVFLVTIPNTLLSSEQSPVNAKDLMGYVTTALFSLSKSFIPIKETSMRKNTWTFCCARRRRTQFLIALRLAAGRLDAAGSSIEPK